MQSGPKSFSKLQTFFTVAAITVLSVSELTYQFAGIESAAYIAGFSFCAVGISIYRIFKLREWLLLCMGVVLSVFSFMQERSLDDVGQALNTAAFFGVFIYLVTLLKEAAERSSSILAVGKYLTNQREGRRYWATTIGGHLFGVLLNFAAISLLSPLIQSGAKSQAGKNGEHTELSRNLEQRQVSALVRGFSWIIIWSPTALTQAVVLSSFSDANYFKVVGLGLFAAVVLIITGRVEDIVRWHGRIPPLSISTTPFPSHATFNLAIVFVSLIASVLILSAILGNSVAICLMLMAPILTTIWIAVQCRREDGISSKGTFVRTIGQVVQNSVRNQTRAVFILGMSAFIGIMAGKLAPIGAIANFVNLNEFPPILFLALLPAIVVLGGQLALSPIMMVVFLSSIINGLNYVPAESSMIVFALASGWALSMSASPNATATLLVSSITGIAPTVLTWRWNGWYAIMSFCVICAIMWVFG